MLVLHSRSAESLELPLACLVIKIEEDNQKSLTRMLSCRHMETPLWRKKSLSVHLLRRHTCSTACSPWTRSAARRPCSLSLSVYLTQVALGRRFGA